MSPGAPDGQAVVLDVAQLQALLAKTFNVGLDVSRGKDPVALMRLRLAKALIGVAEANALAASRSRSSAASARSRSRRPRRWRCMRRRFNGMPDPVFHLDARVMAIVAAVEPDPRASDNDVLLDACAASRNRARAAAALPRRARDGKQRRRARSGDRVLLNAEAELTKASEAVAGLLGLAKISAAAAAAPAPRTSTEDAAASWERGRRGPARRPACVLTWPVMSTSAKEHRMTKHELARQIDTDAGITAGQAASVVDAAFDVIAGELAAGRVRDPATDRRSVRPAPLLPEGRLPAATGEAGGRVSRATRGCPLP